MIKLLLALTLTACTAKVQLEADSGPPEKNLVTWSDCSNEVEAHPCNFTLLDQYGKEWSLYDNIGSILVLDFSAGWCGYCNIGARTMQELQDEYKDRDVIFVTILIEDNYGNPASVDFANIWAANYGITAPVLAGNRGIISDDPKTGWPINGWPRYYFVSREHVVTGMQGGYSDEGLRNTVNAMLAAEEAVAE